ncbi:MAG TPA: class I SAM-dependent methyltransferase [Polyangia bacterium]|nr:class I SAM-dependent methyltransferase [Polyangia bacterium]
MDAEPLVSNVSDTARWVAQYRAAESARPDALFRDPLAARLAGERGRAIVSAGPRKPRNGWSIVARTKLIDDLVMACAGEGSFAPANGVAFFERFGWRAREVQSIARAAVRFRRAPWLIRPFAWLPDPDPRAPGQAN